MLLDHDGRQIFRSYLLRIIQPTFDCCFAVRFHFLSIAEPLMRSELKSSKTKEKAEYVKNMHFVL